LARTSAVARSPVVFFTPDGTQIEIPMSSIYFDDGVLGTWAADPSGKLLPWLTYQATLGRIVATAKPPTSPALVVQAAHAGAYGNRIEVKTAPAAVPTKVDSVDVTVSATDRYADVKVADLAGLLGTAGADGTQPGILLVSDAPPGATEPKKGPVTEAAGKWELAGAGGGPAVKLAARNPGAPFDAGKVLVNIDDGEAAGTFTLVVTWSATAADVVPADFAAAFSPKFDFLVTITQPAGGHFLTPRAGTISLAGGSEQRDAARAEATVPAAD
jgi:hypothetical protein